MSDQIEQAIVTFMSKFCHESITNIEQLSDGMAFNNVLKSLNIKVPPTCDSATWRWPDRLNHLSKLSTLIDERARESGKRISQSDIDLIELCKDYSQNHIISFFQVIVALFIDSPLKEHYVETIMSLD